MIFNDVEEVYVDRLRCSIEPIACDQSCCQIEYSALPFQEALPNHISNMNEPWNANLVIMDQFGVKEVTPDIIRSLARCSATDILFFISTSFIRRFIETPEIRSKYDLNCDEMKSMEYSVIHRYICEYYRENWPAYPIPLPRFLFGRAVISMVLSLVHHIFLDWKSFSKYAGR